jgi:hypothetical protein
MSETVIDLGDELACTRPDLAGANTPYGLLTHCLGVMAYWGGHVVAGRDIVRDRSAEFDATGTADELRAQVDEALDQLHAELAAIHPLSPTTARARPVGTRPGPTPHPSRGHGPSLRRDGLTPRTDAGHA